MGRQRSPRMQLQLQVVTWEGRRFLRTRIDNLFQRFML